VIVLCGLVLWALGANASAQEQTRMEGPPEFYGGSTNLHFISAEEFVSAAPEVCPWAQGQRGFWTNGGGDYLCAYQATLRLPVGALVTGFTVLYSDESSSGYTLGVRLYRYEQQSNGQTDATIIAGWNSSGAPGVDTQYVDIDPDFTVRYYFFNPAQVNAWYWSYAIEVTPTEPYDHWLRGVAVHWKRQVSPAPGTATFGDVPTDHSQFRFIEALAAAGITGGCGSGNYCPNNPVTRGQMAVYLASALGLHYAP
jgi:hypothetical protein